MNPAGRLGTYRVHFHGLEHHDIGPLTLSRRALATGSGHDRVAALWLGGHCLASVAVGPPGVRDGLAVSVGNFARMLHR